MRLWLIIFGIVMLTAFLGLIYIWNKCKKFVLIKKLSGEKKWKLRLFAGIPVLLIVLSFFLDMVVGIVIFLHLVLIWMFAELCGKIIGRVRKKENAKENKVYWEGMVAILGTGIYLCVAYYLAVSVVPVSYQITSDKVKEGDSLRIVMFADSHIGSTFDGKQFASYIEEMESYHPDVLVIVGDYVDDSSTKKDMLEATKALGEIETTYGVYYVFGNHDKGYYLGGRDFTEADLREALTSAGVVILEDEAVELNDSFVLLGRQDKSEPERALIGTIMNQVDSSKYCIVLDHQPSDQQAELLAGADLVLSGHTHGGQLLPINYVGEWFGINDQTKGIKTKENTTFFVTSGISDWAIPFKTGCRSEYVVLDLSANQ